MKTTPLLVILFLGMNGCSSAIRTTTFQQYPPNPEGTRIKIFMHKSPQCEFEEVGIVSARQRNKFISMDEVMESLLSEVRRIGGDAIIGFSESNPIQSANESSIDRDPVLSGTAVKFINQDCMI